MALSITHDASGNVATFKLGGSPALTVDLTGTTLPMPGTLPLHAAALQQVLGVQTWQDMTATRALGTTYTNSTGGPIMVSYWATVSVNGQPAQIIIDGTLVVSGGGAQAAATSGATAIVPNGSTYSGTTSNQAMLKWFELR